MGRGSESSMMIRLTSVDGGDEPFIAGPWKLRILRGPTMYVREAFVTITLEVEDTDGKRMRLEIDPNAPTIETIDKLGRSDSPILQALFRGFRHMMID